MSLRVSCSQCGAPIIDAAACPVCGRRSPFSGSSAWIALDDPSPESCSRFAPGDAFGRRYTIVEAVGEGGMGRVYKAIDRRDGRTVALKVLAPVLLQAPDARERFLRELDLARKIEHPNVCRVHDLGEAEGLLYIVMELIDGRSLHDWVHAVGTLSPRQTVSIIRRVCAGLEAIHSHGIVHRDLKPANIMVTRSGQVVITDFGLAYHPDADRLTSAHEVLGTLPYLAPEQAGGPTSDPRSDIYALGLIFFEMLTGRRPPGDGGPLPLALREEGETCPPPSAFAPDVPPALDAIVLRCLRRDIGERYRSVVEVDRDLAEEAGALSSRPSAKASPGGRGASRRRLAAPVAAAFAAVLAASIAVTLWMSTPQELALLPFDHRGVGEVAYLADILPMLVSHELTRTSRLHLVPYESTRRFEEDDPPALVASSLGADWILQGELERSADGLRVTVRLFGPRAEGGPRWTQRFGGRAARADALASEIAGALCEVLGVRCAMPARAGPDAHALEPYLLGKSYLEGWDVERNSLRAVEAFDAATEADGRFAEAHAGLALALWKHYEETRDGSLVDRARRQARLAVTLAPDLPEAQLALGVVQLGTGRTAEARATFERALELSPGNDAVCRRIGRAYETLGRNEEAEAYYRRAIALRPAYWENHNEAGAFHLDRGDLEEAKRLFGEVVRLRPQSDIGFTNLAAAHIVAGELPQAEPLLLAALEIHDAADVHNNLGFVYYSTGRFEEAVREFRTAMEQQPEIGAYYGNLGDAYRQLERTDAARAAYRRAIELGRARLAINPRDTLERAALAMRLAGAGECRDSVAEIDRALREDPANPQVHYFAAVGRAVCGDQREARQHAVSAIERGALVDVRTNPDLSPLLDAPEMRRLLQ